MRTNERGSVVRLISSAIVLLLAIIASPALAQSADRPVVKVGDEWQFVEYYVVPTRKPNYFWVVTSVTPTAIVGTENEGPLTLTTDLNMVESSKAKFSDRRHLSFPLALGKAWTFRNRVEYKLEGTGTWFDASVAVIAYEKVTVQAGQFDAFKLEATGKYGQQGAAGAGAWAFNSTYWYAPTARAIVKEVFRDGQSAEKVFELVSFKLQP